MAVLYDNHILMSHREIVMAFDTLVHDGSSLYRVSKDIDGYPEERKGPTC